jgi:hypothetical protein
MKLAKMKKGLYSMGPLTEILFSANKRFLNFLADIVDPSFGIKKLEKISETVVQIIGHSKVSIFSVKMISIFCKL